MNARANITLDRLMSYREFMNDKELARFEHCISTGSIQDAFTEEELVDFARRKNMVDETDEKKE